MLSSCCQVRRHFVRVVVFQHFCAEPILSYTNTIFNQSVRVFSLGYFLMHDRKQRVVCHDTIYNLKDVTCGTIQGSVGGLHLFNLFLNDNIRNCWDNHLTKYTGDPLIFVTQRNKLTSHERKATGGKQVSVHHKTT